MTLPPVTLLLPHEGEAVLLDEVSTLREDGLSAWFTNPTGSAFDVSATVYKQATNL